MGLNLQQQAAVNAIDGVFVCIAGPGSGKTTVMIERYKNMLIKGIPSSQILNLTFTNSAAAEMVKRSGFLDDKSVFRTFHSFAIDLLKKERANIPFELCDTIIPVAMEDYQLLFDLVKQYPSVSNFRRLQERISEYKKKNIMPDRAIAEAIGPEYFYALAYQEYERKCRRQGWLDFDSLMQEAVHLLDTNEEVRNRHKRKYIAVDECQDTDIVQFKLLQLIFDGNIFAVGDENQCQPPGTMVSVLKTKKQGQNASVIDLVPIESLVTGRHKLISWDTKRKRVFKGSGKKFKKAVRPFVGELIQIQSNGRITKMTPSHFVWTKFNQEELAKEEGNHFVYLMWKKDLGFRVGTSRFRRKCGSNQFSHWGYQEKAEKMWVLKTFCTLSESETYEEICSLKYGIPECVFHNAYRNSKKTKEQILPVFEAANPNGGYDCLVDHGLLFKHPMIKWPSEKHITKFHGYFKTVAANLIPKIMSLPTEDTYASSPIYSIKREKYSGPVYSLDVEGDHTYIADGIPVGNCIYEWRSAQSGNLTNFSRKFPGAKTMFLGQNYRSTKKLVEFFKTILPVDNGIASHMISENIEGVEPTFQEFQDDEQEADAVLAQITDPGESAIIARTNRQLFLYHKICTVRSIKYKILGKKDFWEENEVKKLLQIAKSCNDLGPADRVLDRLIQQHNLIDLYRNTGKPLEKSPAENLRSVVELAAGKGNIHEFMDFLRKKTHGRKSAKGLTLSTVHQSKGREWNHVFLVGASQGILPHKEGELPEEKRIFFVACSRAGKTLNISYSGNRSMFLNDFVEDIDTHEPDASEG